jgi:hypothetical protein
MRRTVSMVAAVCLLLLVTAAPALAASTPRIHDSGNVSYASASSSTCGASTCTDTYINVFTAQLDTGATDNIVCVDTFTYSIRKGTGGSQSTLCGSASGFTVASDLSSASFGDSALTGSSCSGRRCTDTTGTISGTFSATGPGSSYSYRQSNTYPDCTERYSVKGTNRPASFSGTLNGGAIGLGDGVIGRERYNFSSTCTFGG